jgi:hypothetical protein
MIKLDDKMMCDQPKKGIFYLIIENKLTFSKFFIKITHKVIKETRQKVYNNVTLYGLLIEYHLIL